MHRDARSRPVRVTPRTRPLLTAARSRGALALACSLAAMGVLALATADRVHLLRVATGIDPRPVALVEMLTVVTACCLPAIGAPQLWTWERPASRVVLRVLSGLLVPVAILATAALPWLLQRLGVVVAATPATSLANTLVLAALSTLTCVHVGRRWGPVVGVAAYVLGVGAQALEVDLPLPLQGSVSWATSTAVGSIAWGVTVAWMAVTLGRSGSAA